LVGWEGQERGQRPVGEVRARGQLGGAKGQGKVQGREMLGREEGDWGQEGAELVRSKWVAGRAAVARVEEGAREQER